MVNRQTYPKLGLDWQHMTVNQPVSYPGTATGAKANVYRANLLYGRKRTKMKFKSFTKDGEVYVVRLK